MFYLDAESCDTVDEIEKVIDDCTADSHAYLVNNLNILSTTKKPPDCTKLQPFFSWLPAKVIKKNFEQTNQKSRTPASTMLHKNYKYPFTALNAQKRNESIATDTVYCNATTIDDGSTSA